MPPDETPVDPATTNDPRSLGQRLTRPRVVLVGLVLTLLAVVLLTPEPREAAGELSARSSGPNGARGLATAAERLGWPVRRLEAPFEAPLDTAVVHLILEPRLPLRASEVAAVLDAVRGGGALVVTEPSARLGDSLERAIGVRVLPTVRQTARVATASANACPEGLRTLGLLPAPGAQALLLRTGVTPAIVLAREGVRASRLPAQRAMFDAQMRGDTAAIRRADAALRDELRTRTTDELGGDEEGDDADTTRVARRNAPSRTTVMLPAVAGFTLGAGRVLYVADPGMLRNDVLRHCPWGADLVAIRGLEWVSGGGRPALVFDEYHHGAGQPPGLMHRLRLALTRTDGGRAISTLGIGLLLLALTRGARPLPPATRLRYERRSSLEHVDALARAYAQVGATGTAARRLVRGLRRRHGSTTRIEDDDAFLARVVERHPKLGEPVTLLRQACTTPIANADMPRLVAAVESVDTALTRP